MKYYKAITYLGIPPLIIFAVRNSLSIAYLDSTFNCEITVAMAGQEYKAVNKKTVIFHGAPYSSVRKQL